KCGAFPRQAPRWPKKSAAISLSPFRGRGDDLLYEAGQLKGSVMNSLSIIPRRDAVEVGRYLERIPPLRTERKAPQAAGIRRYRRKVQPAHGKNGAYGRKRLFDQVAVEKRRFGLRDEDSVIRQGFVAGDIEVSTEKSNRGAHGLCGVDDDHVVGALVLLNVADAVGKQALDARIVQALAELGEDLTPLPHDSFVNLTLPDVLAPPAFPHLPYATSVAPADHLHSPRLRMRQHLDVHYHFLVNKFVHLCG